MAHVVATLQTIHVLDTDMEVLRARVAAPGVVWDQTPSEVHVKSIRTGVERLRRRQLSASAVRGRSIAKVLAIRE